MSSESDLIRIMENTSNPDSVRIAAMERISASSNQSALLRIAEDEDESEDVRIAAINRLQGT